MTRARGRVLVATLALLALFSLGASSTDSRNASGARPVATEFTFAAGQGNSAFDASTGGCGAPIFHYRTRDAMAYAALRVQRDRTYVVAEGSVVTQQVTRSYLITPASSQSTYEGPVSSFTTSGVDVRVGHDGDWGGADIGLAGYLSSPRTDLFSTIVFPSSEIRLGAKRGVYAWGDLLVGPATGQGLPAGFGLGHDDERFRGRAGITTQGVLLDGSFRLADGIYVGLQNRTQNHLNWSTLLTVRLGRIRSPRPLHHPFFHGVELDSEEEPAPTPPPTPTPIPLPAGYEPTGHGPLPFFPADGAVIVLSAGDRVRVFRLSDERPLEGTVLALSSRALLLDAGPTLGRILIPAYDVERLARL